MVDLLLVLGLFFYWMGGTYWSYCNMVLDEYSRIKEVVTLAWFISVIYCIIQNALIMNGDLGLKDVWDDRYAYLTAYLVNLALSRRLILWQYPGIYSKVIKIAQLIGGRI